MLSVIPEELHVLYIPLSIKSINNNCIKIRPKLKKKLYCQIQI